MKKILIRGGYKVKPEQIDIAMTLLAGYSHGTASYNFMYVVEYEDTDDNRRYAKAPIKKK